MTLLHLSWHEKFIPFLVLEGLEHWETQVFTGGVAIFNHVFLLLVVVDNRLFGPEESVLENDSTQLEGHIGKVPTMLTRIPRILILILNRTLTLTLTPLSLFPFPIWSIGFKASQLGSKGFILLVQARDELVASAATLVVRTQHA